MKVIENVMPEVMQLQLSDFCTSMEFPWYVLSDATYEHETGVTSFAHLAMWDGQIHSHIFPRIESMLRCIASAAEQKYENILRVRFGLYLPRAYTDEQQHNTVHTDLDTPHTVALYYVNDSDGPTYLFGDNPTTVDPKMGRLVVFDGSTPHASSCPLHTSLRISLNVNFAT